MANLMTSARIAAIKKKNRIDAEDVLMLRREVFGDGVVTVEEAEALFDLGSSCSVQSTEWREFLAEAITDYIVHQEKPTGYICTKNADWLIGAVSRGGKVGHD